MTLITDLMQIIYVSQPFGYDMPTLNGILVDARDNNERDGITGALICRHDIYLQMLEGPADRVQAAFARIARDDRHAGIETIVSEPVAARIFGDWAMLHDPAQSMIWTEQELSDGALERATPDEFRSMFVALAQKAKDDPLI